MFENICMMKKIRVGVDAMSVRTKCLGCRAESSRSCMAMPYKSVLTNQCLGKETNAEPPGRGTEESFGIFPDGQRQIYSRNQET